MYFPIEFRFYFNGNNNFCYFSGHYYCWQVFFLALLLYFLQSVFFFRRKAVLFGERLNEDYMIDSYFSWLLLAIFSRPGHEENSEFLSYKKSVLRFSLCENEPENLPGNLRNRIKLKSTLAFLCIVQKAWKGSFFFLGSFLSYKTLEMSWNFVTIYGFTLTKTLQIPWPVGNPHWGWLLF